MIAAPAPTLPLPADSGTTRRHAELLGIAMLTVVLAFVLQVHGTRVAFPFLPSHPIPELCGSRALFGVACPGCGLTRSFIHLAHGRWTEAYRCNRMGWALALLTVAQVPYRSLCLRGLALVSPRQAQWIGYAMIAGLVLNWLLELAAPLRMWR